MDINILITLVIAIFASTGLWSFVTEVYRGRKTPKTFERDAILGLLHDRIYSECNAHIKKGEIDIDDYNNLIYLYRPYKGLGGNGTCERLMNDIEKLPIVRRKDKD